MMRTALGWITRIASWLVILSVVGLLLVCLVVPRVAGATPYTILTGSMEPRMPPGTLVVTKPVDVDDISIGTVVTYQLASGKAAVVTHRVVGVGADGEGRRVYMTQGDANNVADEKLVQPVQIKGTVWYSVPYLGYVSNLINGKERQVTMIVVVSGLLLYAAFQLMSSLHDRLRPVRGGARRAERA